MKNSNMFSRNRFMNEKKKKKLQFCSCPKWGILNFPGTGNTELEERLTPASDLMNLFVQSGIQCCYLHSNGQNHKEVRYLGEVYLNYRDFKVLRWSYK